MNSHSEAVWVRTRESIGPDEARALLAAEDGITVVDHPGAGEYPMAIDADGKEGVFVGRIRRDLGDPNALALWVVADNLRKGAATNAVQIAEALVARRWVASAAARGASPYRAADLEPAAAGGSA
jgi:aspartate-semialdehyde dehydrogenase